MRVLLKELGLLVWKCGERLALGFVPLRREVDLVDRSDRTG